MICNPLHPCAFVVGVPGQTILDHEQDNAVANFGVRPPNRFEAVFPGELESWLDNHPAGQFLWTGHDLETSMYCRSRSGRA
jgi:hypothetical protein